MELDELKKSWNKLNEHLEQRELIDRQELEKLILKHKQTTRGRINAIAGWGKFSVIIAATGILLLIVSCLFIVPVINLPEKTVARIYVAALFLSIVLFAGGWWDLKSYFWLKKTDIETLPVVRVVERINRFRLWINYEITGIAVVLILLTGVIYYLYELYEKSALIQTVFFVFCILIISLVAFLLYKKVIFDNLRDIKKNLDELQELKNY